MKRFVVAMAAVLTLAGLGCSDDNNGGGGGNGPPQDKAWVRFGNLSPDAPPIDLCVRQSGTQSFGSPVLRSNGLDAGLAFPAMSKVILARSTSAPWRREATARLPSAPT
jgi:hypothetical protein